nr:hypothetical protein [Tanacetum cinerariifolium]
RETVVIRDPQEESTTSIIIPAETKSKDKAKGILVEEPKPLKKQQQIKQDENFARELEAELNKNIDLDEVIDHVKKKAKEDPTTKEQIIEEESRALKRLRETPAKKATKRKKWDEEVKELKRHLQIMPNQHDDVYTEATLLARKVPIVDYEIIEQNNKPYYKIIRADDDDVYIEATPLARKVYVVDYQIIKFNNKPYYKIIRADDTHQLYVSFPSLLRNFDREDLEALWSLVKERFSTTKPKNFFDDFLIVTLRAMFEKLDIHAQFWKN